MNYLQANLCLLCVTFCWSTEVVIFACIPDAVSPFAVTSITFLVGGALLFLAFGRRIATGLRADRKKQLLRCLWISVINAGYNTLYQFGLADFDVSTGAFTLSLTVVTMPFILLLMRSRVGWRTWLSSGIVLAGILFAMVGVMSRAQLPGLSIIAIGCVMRAYYIIKLNQYAREHDPVVLSALICVSGGVVSYFFWMAVQPNTFMGIPWSPVVIATLAIYSFFVVALAITLNVFAQRRATPANATIIYSTEIVFSVILGAALPSSLIDPVHLTPFLVAGVVCVVVGNLIEILDPGKMRNKGEEAVT